jgi:hypothetical protein
LVDTENGQKESQRVNRMNKHLSAGIALAVIALVLFLALAAAGPAFSARLAGILALGATPTPTPGPVIPIKSITDLTSLEAAVNIEVNGLTVSGHRWS